MLHELDFVKEGFEWVDLRDWEGSVHQLFEKRENDRQFSLLSSVISPQSQEKKSSGGSTERFLERGSNSDAKIYGGSATETSEAFEATPVPSYKWKSFFLLFYLPSVFSSLTARDEGAVSLQSLGTII